jgi:transposase-like protein
LRSSDGKVTIQVPRDRNGEFEPQIVKKHTANTNELEDKIIGMYAKGLSVRDVQDTLQELYGIEVCPTTISVITDKVGGWWKNGRTVRWQGYTRSFIWMAFTSICAEMGKLW